MFASDMDSERATSIEDYQNTCTGFIMDISKDYKDWVDRYNLPPDEEKFRKKSIDQIVETTNDYMIRFGDTIKKIDIIMNDGINKMAETTAGYPFKFEILVNENKRYIVHEKKPVKINIKSIPGLKRRIRICNYDKDRVFLLSSSNPVELSYSDTIFESTDLLDEFIVIKPTKFDNWDVVSITVKIEEIEENIVTNSRGYTSLIVTK